MSEFVNLYESRIKKAYQKADQKMVVKKGDQDHPLFEPGNYKEAIRNIKHNTAKLRQNRANN